MNIDVQKTLGGWRAEIEAELASARAELHEAERQGTAASEALAIALTERRVLLQAFQPFRQSGHTLRRLALAPPLSTRLEVFDGPVESAEGRRETARTRVAEAKRTIDNLTEALDQLRRVIEPQTERHVLAFEKA